MINNIHNLPFQIKFSQKYQRIHQTFLTTSKMILYLKSFFQVIWFQAKMSLQSDLFTSFTDTAMS